MAQNSNVDKVRAEVERICRLDLQHLRLHYFRTFQKPAAEALTRDILCRLLAWHIQARAFGGHDRETSRLLARLANSGRPSCSERNPGLGTQFIREYKGVRHTVTLETGGLQWQGKVYRSLSAIAREITGTNWNGRRFFGVALAPHSDTPKVIST